jgi:hypothetical protein
MAADIEEMEGNGSIDGATKLGVRYPNWVLRIPIER